MPKNISLDDEKPRRRRKGAVAIEPVVEERHFALRVLLHSPKDMLAGLLAFAAVSAIIANAIFLQAGRHPAPMFGSSVIVPMPVANPLPRPRPVDAATKPVENKSVELRAAETKPVESKPEAKPDAVASLMKAAPAPAASAPRPPAAIPTVHRDPLGDLITSSRRVASVQRALTEYGYGQLKPTGTVGSDTQAAIQKFERERKLPVTGQMSDRLVRELSAATGKTIE